MAQPTPFEKFLKKNNIDPNAEVVPLLKKAWNAGIYEVWSPALHCSRAASVVYLSEYIPNLLAE